MFRAQRIWLLSVVACAVLLGMPGVASANWLTIKNESGLAIVVQETIIIRGEVKRGKATNLLPGETFREYLPAPTVKRIEVFDSRNRDQAVWSGKLNCEEATQAFAVKSTGGKVAVTPVSPPKRR